MNINKSQAALLADGFLDNLGSTDKGDFQPKNVLEELFLIAGELVNNAQSNLNSSNSNASGNLSASLTLGDPTRNGNIVRVDVLMAPYGKFVNKGVKGLVSGKSLAGYSFKTAFPSGAMVKSLEAGIAHAKQKTSSTDVKKYGAHGQHEKKLANLSAYSKAYGAGVNIKKFGIKPTGFLDKAIVTAAGSVRDRLGAALKVDIINSITQ